MLRKSAIIGLAAMSLCAPAAPAEAASSHREGGQAFSTLAPEVSAAVDQVLNSMVGEKGITGAAIGISEKGQIKFLKGYGMADLEHRVPMSKDSAFLTGSIGKQFTAAAILLLAEQGRLSIDDPLSKYLPDFPRAGEVTLKQMMNHTSGISDKTSSVFLFVNAPRTKDDVLKIIRDADPLYDFEPGTKWSYSNAAYILLGAVIEKASGEGFAEVVRKNIFVPLGMKNSAYHDPMDIVPDRARGYSMDRKTGQLRNAPAATLTGIVGGAGGARSTAEDMLKFEDALLDGKLLSKKSFDLMMTPAHLKNGELATQDASGKPLAFRYSLGTSFERLAGYEVVGQNGAVPGYHSWLYRVPEADMTVMVLANMSGRALPIATKLVPAIIQAKAAASKRR